MAASTRRAPLASIPNATNSPHRFVTASGSKRPRALAGVTQQENEPPSKRQAVEKPGQEHGLGTPRYQQHSVEGKVFERGHGETGTTAFQRRLVAARDKTAQPVQSRTTRSNTNANTTVTTKDVDTIRQWQKHYRKLFPSFSFYFDSVPEDQKSRFVRQIHYLGAREEKFFSRHVTHIITTRPIPPADKTDGDTVNPAVLDKNGRSAVRRDVHASDILSRGQQMDMKIWAAEKLQRMLASLLEDRSTHDTTTRPNDLRTILKNEKLASATEKEQAVMSRELVYFRGPFIYVHDMDEKVRPIMVREYTKVARRTDGEWPQFRSASMGKCPFVEDPQTRRDLETDRAKQKALFQQQQQQQQQQQEQRQTRARSTASAEPSQMQPPRRISPRKVSREVMNLTPAPPPMATTVPAGERQSSFPPMPEQPSAEFVKPSQLQLAREPPASGIQRSAVTSAIQSQMISSTTATGVKASTSKEVNHLKRKVLERTTTTGSMSIPNSVPSSHQTQPLAVLRNARAPAPQRAAKSRAQEKLGGVPEEIDPYAEDVNGDVGARAAAKKTKKPVKRDPKPGYCENCRDKYDDFEEHILSRKHRKFATTHSNWTELDALLAQLQSQP